MPPHPPRHRFGVRRRAWGSSCAILSLALAYTLAGPPAGAGGLRAKADHLKAAFAYKLTLFVTWPSEALPPEDEPLVLCVAGRDTLRDALGEAVAGRTAHGHGLEVRAIDARRLPDTCHVLLLDDATIGALGGGAPPLGGRAVLVVGEGAGFAARGGMIGLVERDRHRLGFEVNRGAIESAGIHVRSQLLRLGTPVGEAAPAAPVNTGAPAAGREGR